MNLRTNIPAARRQSGMTLIECMMYMVVFAILLGIATMAFYFCWDHTRATILSANQIESALRAGECWRADVRAATGKIAIETTDAGETVKIPEGAEQILYRLENGELRRDVPAHKNSRLLLESVQVCEMKTEMRDSVTAWRWELELKPRRIETRIPMRFTFEAAQMRP